MTRIACRVMTGVAPVLIWSAALATDGREPTTTPGSETLTLVAAGAAVTVDPASGKVTSIRLRDVEEMATEHPAGSEKPFGYLEVIDLRDHRRYNPVLGKPSIVKLIASGEADEGAACFEQQYDGAPFAVRQTLRETPAGVRWEATLRLLEGQEQNRSVRVHWVLPLPYGWHFRGPNSATASQTNGGTPYRVVYGHTDPGTWATVIPLVGVWGEKAGAAVFSPPDVRKCQISFDVLTQDCLDAGRGVVRQTQDLQSLRIAHHMVGLRPGRELRLAICIAGTAAAAAALAARGGDLPGAIAVAIAGAAGLTAAVNQWMVGGRRRVRKIRKLVPRLLDAFRHLLVRGVEGEQHDLPDRPACFDRPELPRQHAVGVAA